MTDRPTIHLTSAGTVIEVDLTDPAACAYRYVSPVSSGWSDRPVALVDVYTGGWEPVEEGANNSITGGVFEKAMALADGWKREWKRRAREAGAGPE